MVNGTEAVFEKKLFVISFTKDDYASVRKIASVKNYTLGLDNKLYD